MLVQQSTIEFIYGFYEIAQSALDQQHTDEVGYHCTPQQAPEQCLTAIKVIIVKVGTEIDARCNRRREPYELKDEPSGLLHPKAVSSLLCFGHLLEVALHVSAQPTNVQLPSPLVY